MSEPSSATILLLALDLLDSAAKAPSKVAAVDAAREAATVALSDLDAEAVQRVAACLAVECVSALRSGKSPRSVQEWIDRVRLEATWAAS